MGAFGERILSIKKTMNVNENVTEKEHLAKEYWARGAGVYHSGTNWVFFYSKMSSFVSYHFWKSTLGWLKIKYILYKNTMSWKLIFFIGKNVKLTQNSHVFLDELGKTGSIKFKFKSIWFFIFFKKIHR